MLNKQARDPDQKEKKRRKQGSDVKRAARRAKANAKITISKGPFLVRVETLVPSYKVPNWYRGFMTGLSVGIERSHERVISNGALEEKTYEQMV